MVRTKQEQIRSANQKYHICKNRLMTILPYDYNRVVLVPKAGDPNSDYINASYIDDYSIRRGFVATQAPLVDTVEDFWRMVYKVKANSVVMLTDLSYQGQEQSVMYWPDNINQWNEWKTLEGRMVPTEEICGEIAVLKMWEGPAWEGAEGFVTKITLGVYSNTNPNPEDTHQVDLYQVHNWPTDSDSYDPHHVIHLARLVHAERPPQVEDEKVIPIIVHCSAGNAQSGAFIALSNTIQRIDAENAVDVFQAVKSLRFQRQHMVQTLEQYRFVYRGAAAYLNYYSAHDMESRKSVTSYNEKESF